MKIAKFSLAELILLATVCLGIFALVVPILYNARQESQMTTCVTHLGRAMGNAIITYTGANDGYMPAWEEGWVKAVSTAAGAPVDQGSLPKDEWACPAQAAESNGSSVEPTAWWRGTHYGINQHLASNRTHSDGTALPLWTRTNLKKEAAPSWRRVKSPHDKALAADAAGGNVLGIPNMDPVITGSGPNGRGCSLSLPPKPTPGLPYRRHANGMVNVLFLDLHVDSLSRFPEFMLGRGTEGFSFWHGEQWYPESGERKPPKLVESLKPNTSPTDETLPKTIP